MIIRKGTHSPFRLPRLLIDPKVLEYNVTFTPSCIYDIGRADQADVNKLFGIGYFPHHHKNSVRFGWRYNPDFTDSMEIMAYWYDDGERMMRSMGFVDIGKQYTYEMWVLRGVGSPLHHLKVSGGGKSKAHYLHQEVLLDNPCDIGYLLRPYFGGNQTAPHDMKIIMEKV